MVLLRRGIECVNLIKIGARIAGAWAFIYRFSPYFEQFNHLEYLRLLYRTILFCVAITAKIKDGLGVPILYDLIVQSLEGIPGAASHLHSKL